MSSHSLEPRSTPGSLGTVTGGGSVSYGTKIKLKANPKDDCEFVNWIDEKGNVVSNDKSFIVEAIKNTSYTAVFRKLEIDKTYFGNILKDDVEIVKKVRMKGGQWTLNNGMLVSPENDIHYKIIEMDIEIPEGKCFKLSSKANWNDSWGMEFYCTVDDLETYNFYLNSEQEESLRSVYLSSGIHTIQFVCGSDASYNALAKFKEIAFTEVTGTATIKATCREEYYTLGNELSGTVEGTGEYSVGQIITLKAPVIDGSHTVKWVAKTSTYSVSISNIRLIDEESLKEETFSIQIMDYRNNYAYSVKVEGAGGYKYGEEATLKAIEENGNHFLGWIAPDGTFIKDSEIKVTVNKDMVYNAYFTNDSVTEGYKSAVIADEKYSIEFGHSMWAAGVEYIQTDDSLPDIPLTAVITVPEGEEDMLSFNYSSYEDNYSLYDAVEGYLTVCVNGKEELRIPYDLNETDIAYNVPLAAGKNTVEWNFIQTAGTSLDYWNVSISNIDIKNAKYYTISAAANNASYGTIIGSGEYVYSQSVILKAVPNKGYIFKTWMLDGEEISDEAEYSTYVIGDAQYTAVFEADPNYKGDDDQDDSSNDDNGNGDEGQGDSGKTDNKTDDKNTHKHTAGDWTIVKEATAKETGIKVKKCTVCGEEMEREVLPKYKVSFNVKGTVPLQLKKSTTAIKVNLMDGDKVKSYKSSNKKIVTVNKKGKITAKKTGKAKITVTTVKGAKATITIKVQKSPVKTKKITVDKKKLTLKKGKSYTLTVTKTPITTLEKTSFTTSNKKVATVNKKGKIVAKKKGTATITVKSGKKKKTVKVTVK